MTLLPEQRQLAAVERELAHNQLFRYKPYPKQVEFHTAGGTKGIRDRLLIAGNQLGKTLSASRETAMHLTGMYPDWWKGARFLRPTKGWAASLTSQGTRDTVQRLLLGAPGQFGTGAIPKKMIEDVKKATHGVADSIETVIVRHQPTGGLSYLTLKTYDQGRERWQGDTLNFCVAEGQRVQLADGRYVAIEQVLPGDEVRTVGNRGEPVVRKVVAVHDRGERDIVEVQTSRGPWLRLTPDHEVFENARTKTQVQDATQILQMPGDWEPEDANDAIPEAWFAWAGLVVAEGSVSCRKVTMGAGAAIDTAVSMLPPEARVRCKEFDAKHKHVPDWFLYWDEFWEHMPQGLAHEKEVPEWVFRAKNAKVAVFLSYLFSGDGWASGHCIGHASTSRVLAEQVSVLLWRFGIRTSVTRRPATARWREQWHVHVSSSENVLRFAERVGIVGKERALGEVVAEACRREMSKKARSVHLIREDVPEARRAYAKWINKRNQNRVAKIVGVEPAGRARVYDLSIETDHKFVVGTGVVSNCWFDEEPPEDVYDEGLTRLVATGGISYMTFTPLLGMSAVVSRFLKEKRAGAHVTTMTIHDALHFTPEERAAVIARYPEHQREARAMGKPLLGSGLVFPYPEESLKEHPIVIPDHWPRIAAIDFGYDHPTAIVWAAWDRDADVVHIYDAYRVKERLPAVHSAAIRARGAWIPVAWPHDGDVRDGRNSGETFAQQYRGLGVNMMNAKATHAPDRAQGQKEGDGGTSTEAGITLMADRLMTGRLRVARHLNDWFEEYGLYHRKDGLIVKEMDDLMSATRILVMMLRHAKVKEQPREMRITGFAPLDPGLGALG